jgi:N-acetylglucosaminyldiphosphoundecaprenol N-acetyl-beta-D-mannosaminyltransferase
MSPAKTNSRTLIYEAGCYTVLGVSVNALQIPDVISRMEYWIAQRRKCHYVAITGTHSLIQAQHSAGFKQALCDADLVVPQGLPLLWLGRRKGFALRRRVHCPELMEQFCRATAAKGYRHFFYGGVSGVAADSASGLALRFAGLQVAGAFSPPFRPLTPEEDRDVVAAINASRPDVVWIGLGAPEQERWMFEHRHLLNAPVLVGVGSAFGLRTGRAAQTPTWIRNCGFQSLFHFAFEPRCLWRRYLLHGTQFAGLVFLEAFGFRKFN